MTKKNFSIFLIGFILLAGAPVSVQAFEPKRGNRVPSDAGIKIHPFIEQLTFQSKFRPAIVTDVTPKHVDVKLNWKDQEVTRSIPASNIFLGKEYLAPGQRVIVKWAGEFKDSSLLLTNQDRRGKFIFILGGSLLICVLIGGWITMRATLGMGIGIAFFFLWSLPQIQAGAPVVWEVMLFYLLVTLLVLPASLGWNRKALSAIGASLATGVISAGMLEFGARWIGVVGLRNESLQVIEYAIRYFPQQVAELSIPSIVVGATIIGALGVILDVSVDVTSSAAEIARARPDLSFTELLSRTITVSSRLVGTMTNTLLLAYVGSNLFLLLTIYILPDPVWITLNQDFVAMEVLRGLGGALGFLGAVPLSVFFYWLLFQKYGLRENKAPNPPKNPTE